MSTKRCCVPGCINYSGSKYALHKFPHPVKYREMFNTWVYSIGGPILGCENDHIYKYRRVCHIHFKEKYWCQNNRLSNIAVPTKNLPGITLHVFPNPRRDGEIERFRTWVMKIGGDIVGEEDLYIHRNRRVCHRHFEEIYTFPNHRLTRLAIPLLHIPGCSDHTYSKDIKEHKDHTYVRVDDDANNQTSGILNVATKDNNSGADKDGSDGHEVPVADDVPDDTEAVPEDAAEVASGDAPDDLAPTDPEYEELIKGVFSWETEELIISADDTDVPAFREEANAPTDLELDVTDFSMYQDDDPCVFKDNSGDDHSYSCNECGERITGFRYTCVQCADWDVCGACEARAHAAHYLLRVPRDRPYNEIQAVLATIRRDLLSENHFVPERAESVKSEPEEPPPEPDPLGAAGEEADSSDDDDVPDVLEGDGDCSPPRKRRCPSPHSPPPPEESPSPPLEDSPPPSPDTPSTLHEDNLTRSRGYSTTHTTHSTNVDRTTKTLNITKQTIPHHRKETRRLIPVDASKIIRTIDLTTPDWTPQNCSEERKQYTYTRMRTIAKHKTIDENTSELSVEKSTGAKSGDELARPRPNPCTDTTALTAPTTSPNMGSAERDTRAMSKMKVLLPAGFDPVEVVKMLNSKVSVRLKPMKVSRDAAVNKKIER